MEYLSWWVPRVYTIGIDAVYRCAENSTVVDTVIRMTNHTVISRAQALLQDQSSDNYTRWCLNLLDAWSITREGRRKEWMVPCLGVRLVL